MSAQPQKRPSNSAPDPVVTFRERYAEAMAGVRISAEHTATEGWHRLYHGQRQENLERRRELAKEMKATALRLEDMGLSEEDEKSIGELKKSVTAIREAFETFDQQTISPVRQPVRDCDRIRSEAMAEARRIEAEAPMINIGMEELMRVEVAKVDKPRWDNETGRVLIDVPNGAVD